MRELYLECYSGISGDMSVAALLDIGASEEHLRKTLKTMPLSGYSIEITRVKKSGIDACDFNVILDKDNHDHDMEYLHGHSHKDKGETVDNKTDTDNKHISENAVTDTAENEEHHHHHNHDDEHSHHHSHEHRGLAEINDIIDKTELTVGARELAKDIFLILAKAEAKTHATDIENVHFHEVGAVDSIVDIVAFAVCFDELKIDRVYVPFLCEGFGTIRCQHGVIPVPVPAVSNIVAEHNIVLSHTHIKGELVTPTGAAIVAAVRTDTDIPFKYMIEKVGYGAGKREYEVPSMLRAMLIDSEQHNVKDLSNTQTKDCIYKLETDIDDCSGETMGHVMQIILENGAREVHYTPVFMKKNRPAYELVVLCKKEKISRMEEILFTETTTIGIRRSELERTILKRRAEKIRTFIGEAQVKICTLPNGKERCYPEYDSASALAKEAGISFREAYDTIVNCWKTER